MSNLVLITDDDPVQRGVLRTLLARKLSYDSLEAENGRECLLTLQDDRENRIKLLILDLSMPVMDGLETLEIVRQQYPELPILILTGSRDVEKATMALKLGAVDFLTKPVEAQRMVVSIQNALKIGVLSREVSRLKKQTEGTFSFSNLIGHDGGLTAPVALGRKAAASDIPVLITGETGTGKEVFARAIHGESARAGNAFIAVNCGAIPQNLIESTLFGHEKGAFTGAVAKTPGKFREANGGTIFLDEIGELPPDAQTKLLRVLQQKEVEPVGAALPLPVDVRIISATNRQLEEEVAKGRFREDLYFRLHVLPIALPGLRERKQDIASLVRHFTERFAASEKRPLKDISEDALRALLSYPWPGNVRELENTIHRATVLSDKDILEADDFTFFKGAASSDRYESAASGLFLSLLTEDGNLKTLEEAKSEILALALKQCEGNVTKAANALGIAKSTFYRKMDTA